MIAQKGLKDAPMSFAAILVSDYCNRLTLRKLGYELSLSELTQFEVEAFTLIASEFARLEEKRMEEKVNRTKSKSGKR